MKIFPTVEAYLKEAQEDDIIAFSGNGKLDGIASLDNKYNTFKVQKDTNEGQLLVKEFRGRDVIKIDNHNQRVALLNKMEFRHLKVIF